MKKTSMQASTLDTHNGLKIHVCEKTTSTLTFDLPSLAPPLKTNTNMKPSKEDKYPSTKQRTACRKHCATNDDIFVEKKTIMTSSWLPEVAEN